MPIVQISKIIHRTGSTADLPQLDIGEIGFASDDHKVFIGNDPLLPPPNNNPVRTPDNTEVLTEYSEINVERLTNFVSNVVPETNESTGIKGQVAYDDDYIYLCVDTDTWVRAARDAW
jgi:hypothetical protein